MAINKFVSTRNDKRSRLIPFSGGLDDGSTLNLDFTRMGTGADLSARGITFSRSSPATFINSSGYVDFPEINLFRNSSWSDSNPTPTNWTGAGNAPTIPSSGQRTFTVTTAATSYIAEAGTAATLANGLQYTASVDVVSVSGAVTFSNLINATASPTNSKWYLIVGGDPPAEYDAADLVPSEGRVVFTFTSGTSSFIRLGLGVTGVNQTGQSVTLKNPMLTPGIKINTNYVPSASSTAPYYGPRFDYNPTTLAARGLLIEGSTTNILNYSESFATSGSGLPWNYNLYVTRNATQILGPDGNTAAYQFNETTDNQIHRISNTGAIGSAGAYSFSVWVKVLDPSTPRRLFMNANTFMGAGALFDINPAVQTGASGSAVAVSGTAANRAGTWVKYPNNWYRCTVLGTYAVNSTVYLQINRSSSTAATDDTFAGSTSNGLAFWGAQLEAGSGASSYIPTGASTVQRAVDQMTMANIAALNFNQSGGTVFMQVEGNPRDRDTFPYFAAFEQSPSGRGWAFLRLNNSTTSGLRMLGTAFTGAGSTIISSTVHTRPSGKFKFAATLEPSVCRMTYAIAGGSALVDTATAGTLATIGSLKFNNTTDTGASEFGSVWISQFKYWPSVLPNATLQSITA